MNKNEPRYIKNYAHFDEMSWPLPDSELEWDLRYGNPTKSRLLHCASIVRAYQELILATQKKRQRVISVLRKGMENGQ